MSSPPAVAEIVPAGRGAAARPVFGAEPPRPISLGRTSRGKAEIGDLVVLEPRGRGVRVREVLGRADDPDAVQRGLLLAEGLPGRFPAAVDREAAERPPSVERADLREQEVVTIDPEGARDHDDAIFARHEADDVRLWVHIADVSHFVPEGGAVDREAARRGNSVYLPGRVVPMLPEILSADACSLRAGVDRPAVTAELLIRPDGEVATTRFYRSRVRSRADLTYEDAVALLAGEPPPEIAAAAEGARRLGEARRRRGALQIASGEPRFSVAEGRVDGMSTHRAGPAHALIEDCMIAANEAVARHLMRAGGGTAVFRHHPDPADSAIRRLYDQLAGLGVATPPLADEPLAGAAARRAAAGAAAAAARSDARAPGMLVLRALQRAHYSVTSPGHSGLASEAYLHFTSPIRRYPDLVVHRALMASLGRGTPPPGAVAAEAAEVSSATERQAADLERRVDRILAALMIDARGPSPAVEGEVVGLLPGGAFLLTDEGWEGFLPARWIADDYFHRDELEIALVGESTGTRVRLGDRVAVRVARCDPLRGRIDLELAAPAGSRRRHRSRRR